MGRLAGCSTAELDMVDTMELRVQTESCLNTCQGFALHIVAGTHYLPIARSATETEYHIHRLGGVAQWVWVYGCDAVHVFGCQALGIQRVGEPVRDTRLYLWRGNRHVSPMIAEILSVCQGVIRVSNTNA